MPSRVLARAAQLTTLVGAWEVVRRNDEADGIRSGGVERFAAELTGNLEEIAAALERGSYRPRPLIGVAIPKPSGGVRRLQIPCVADRIVERALVEVLTDVADPWLVPWTFAYRPGLSVFDAHRLLATERDAGSTHVVRADLRDCFGTLDRGRVVAALAERVDDPPLISLVRQLCDRPAWWRGALRVADRGVAQGSPLSPLLCNLYLDSLDRALLARGWPAIRYSDDLALPVVGADAAQRALRCLRREVDRVALALHPDKTEVMSFSEGFVFLGEEFAGPYPAVTEPRQQPDRRTLYVGRQGASVHLRRGQVVVTKGSEQLLAVPQSQVGRIALFGAVGLSCVARAHALYHELPVVFLSRRGRFLGRLDSADPDGTALRRAQFAASTDTESRLRVATGFVLGKLANQRALLLRYGARSRDPESIGRAVDDIDRYARLAAAAEDCGQLIGMEGAAARRYFEALPILLPPEYPFPGRSRRPPMDLVNAMLSLGYACLTAETTGAVAAAGLDPAIGVLHADGDRPGLALDLVEEFRPVVVDSVVLNCARRGIVAADATRPDPQGRGVYLTEAARVAFLEQLELRLLTLFSYTPTRVRVSYRRAMYLQARQLASLIRSGVTNYEPIRWR